MALDAHCLQSQQQFGESSLQKIYKVSSILQSFRQNSQIRNEFLQCGSIVTWTNKTNRDQQCEIHRFIAIRCVL